MKRLASLLLFALAAASLNAQVSQGGNPLFNYSKAAVAPQALPAVDNRMLLAEDDIESEEATPTRVGVMRDVDIDLLSVAEKRGERNGMRIATYAIQSPGATSMAICFDQFEVPEGAMLFFYNVGGDFVIGGFNKDSRQPDGSFYTQSIPGDVVIVEYQEPIGAAAQSKLHINRVLHGYKDILPYSEEKGAGSCNYNFVCDSAGWSKQAHAVCKMLTYTTSGAFLCTGALINNTANDHTPYVLTANHCTDGKVVTGYMFYFNYMSATCSGNTAITSTQTVAGAEKLANRNHTSGSDFLLLRLNKAVPEEYEPYFAGWQRHVDGRPTKGRAIHHPAGDIKKISTPNSVAPGSGTYGSFYEVYWAKGVVEGGSSGSPLFNAEKQIIGQLYGGRSSCDNQQLSDYYGRLNVSWVGGGSASNRLMDWLDPINSNVMSLQGISWNEGDSVAIPPQTNLLHVYPNPSNGMFRVDVEDIGEAIYYVYDIQGRLVYEGKTIFATTTQAINLMHLPKGAYSIDLSVGDKKYANTLIIEHK
ncbi:MAG: T9SS type A sorting domain-containing protein [Bacteroidales bacterium]|nr:T9SS type A sorting domain-containing protein [Bacteroidales bacterium]